jgi:D-apionolactonase
MVLARAIKLFGTDVPDGKKRVLTAGPLSATLDNGALRDIRYRGVEVLRGIAFLVRDKNWGTYAPDIPRVKVRETADGFTVSYIATCKDADQAIRYDAMIDAKSDGTLTFLANGMPLTDFITNRTGFVVLHPLEGVVGKPVEVIHTDGRREKRAFPKLISPGQPIFEIRSLRHTVMPGVTATVLMEGNKFEMEDHRNWMDASYKTYVCSLLDPWPYTLKKDEGFLQSIQLTLSGKPAKAKAAKAGGAVAVSLGGAKGRLPAIGVGVPMGEGMHALAEADLLAAARPAHLVCQIDGRRAGQADAASAFRELSERTKSPVTLEMILPAREPAMAEAAKIAEAVRAGGLTPARIVITQMHDLKSFQPGAPRPWGPSHEEMAAAARAAFPATPVGGGMLSFFTELNRKRPPQGLFDFITHTVCPIVHAADDVSVMETLESLPSIFASARAIIGKAPYHLGPSSIPARDNPYGAATAPNPANGRVCLSDMDPRQRGLFAAAWTLGLAAAAARGSLDAMTLGAATGPQGAIYRKAAYPQPGFDGGSAKLYPAFHVLAGLAPASGMRRLEAVSGAPSNVAALAYLSKAGPVLWLANLSAETRRVKLAGMAGPVAVRILDERTFTAAARDPDFFSGSGEASKKPPALDLGAYAVARVSSV